MTKKSKVTLKDIASIVGISTNSVSKALRNKTSISKDTRLKVQEIADKLGYIPNAQALALKNGFTNVVAVIYDNLINPYYSLMLKEINDQLFNLNYETMVFVDHHSIGYLSKEITRKVISYNVYGILSFLEPTSEAKAIIDEYNIPFILVGRKPTKIKINAIYSDDYNGGRLAAQILLKNNSHNFLYYTIHDDLEVNKRREKGFKDYLHESSIPEDNIKTISIHTDKEFNKDNLLKTVKNNINVDGIFCFNDLLAFELIQILYENNLLSSNINIIGYDNIQSLFPYPIKVSSISPNVKEIVKQSLQNLLNYNNHKIIDIMLPVYFFKGNNLK